VGSEVTALRAVHFGWVFILEHMKLRPGVPVTKYLSYKGKRLGTLMVGTRVVNLTIFNEICLSALRQIGYITNAGPVQDLALYYYLVVCHSALMAGVQPHKALLDSSYVGDGPQLGYTTNAWLQAKVPPQVAYYIQQCAPVVMKGQLFTPQIEARPGRSAPVMSSAGTVGGIGDALFDFPIAHNTAPTAFNVAVDGVVINSAWVTAMGSTMLQTYYLLSQEIMDLYHHEFINNNLQFSDAFSAIILNDFGSASLLCRVVVNRKTAVEDVSTQYKQTYHSGVTIVGSPVQLHNVDIAEAILHGYCIGTSQIVDDMAFRFQVPGSRGGTNYGDLVQRETMNNNGAYARAIAAEKIKSSEAKDGPANHKVPANWLRETLKPIYSAVLRDVEGVLPEAYELAKGAATNFARRQLYQLASSSVVYYLSGRLPHRVGTRNLLRIT